MATESASDEMAVSVDNVNDPKNIHPDDLIALGMSLPASICSAKV